MKAGFALSALLLLALPVFAGEKIDINKAPIVVLDKLEVKGTGAMLSERIQAGRPYKSIGDLTKKKVITYAEFEAIEKMIKVAPVPPKKM